MKGWIRVKLSVAKILGALLVLGVAVAVALGVRPSEAQVESAVGYIDYDMVIETHAGSQIAAVLEARDRLQAEFDEKSKDLSETEKRALFSEYEERLKQFEQDIGLAERMRQIDDAIAQAASESGVGIVIDRGVVVYGGVELTEAVIDKLSADE